jgi:hypothetical protein
VARSYRRHADGLPRVRPLPITISGFYWQNRNLPA